MIISSFFSQRSIFLFFLTDYENILCFVKTHSFCYAKGADMNTSFKFVKVLLLLLILITFSTLFSLQKSNLQRTIHFTPVWSGNGYQHANIYVNSATINTVPLNTDDEIAVYDGQFCVGMAKLTSAINPYVSIVVSLDDPTTPEIDGYSVGNPISFKLWKEQTQTEYAQPLLLANFVSGPSVFEIGATSLVQLAYGSQGLYQLNLNVIPQGTGSVNGAGNFFSGNPVTISAQANTGYYFAHWANTAGDIITIDNPYTFSMPAVNTTINAHFALLPQTAHYQKVWADNGFQHMNIYVDQASFFGNPLQLYDEVAVFDGQYCVGTYRITENNQRFLPIVCSLDDPTTPIIDGYTAGHSISFKFWHYQTQREYVSPTLDVFVVSGPNTYEIGASTLVQLHITNETLHHLNLIVNPANSGIVNGYGVYTDNSLATISAQANEGFYFSAWMMNNTLISNEANYTFNIQSDMTLTALFLENPNIAPQINLPESFTLSEDTPLSINLSPYLSDPDNILSELLLTGNSSQHIHLNINSQNATFSPQLNWSGSEYIYLTVDDQEGRFRATATDSVLIIVNPVNDAPVVSQIIAPITFNEDTTYSQLNLSNHFTDPDLPYVDHLTFSHTATVGFTIQIQNAQVTITPNANWFGAQTVSFSATDSQNLMVSTNVLITINPLNDAPQITTIVPDSSTINLNVNQDQLFIVIALDADNDNLTYQWTLNNQILPNTDNQLLTSFPNAGNYTLSIQISDGQLNAQHTWTIIVHPLSSENPIPLRTQLMQNYPNPFNPSTTISYALNNNDHIQISIYNTKGQLIRTLLDQQQSAGIYNILWDGKNDHQQSIASGLYFLKMQSSDYTNIKKMIMMK